MFAMDVAGRIDAEVLSNREEPRVFARTTVVNCAKGLSVAKQSVGFVNRDGPIAATLERRPVEADALEPRVDSGNVLGLAAVAGRTERQLDIADGKRLGGAGADQRQPSGERLSGDDRI